MSDQQALLQVGTSQFDPATVAAIERSVENRVRIARLETEMQDIKEEMRSVASKITDLHNDLVGRKAILGVAGTFLKYLGWGIAGLGALFGISNSNAALTWLKNFPHS